MTDKKFTHVDLFCGAGGFGLGFKQAGFEHIFANDMNKDACATYELNLGLKPVRGKLEDIEIGDLGEVDVLTAGFPCQPFSVAGKKNGWKDDKASFYDSLIKFIARTDPKFIVFENVKGFVKHNKGKSIQRLLANIEHLGYDVTYKVLNSNDYGVAQKRERVIIVANRLGIENFEYPQEHDYKPVVGDIFTDLPESEGLTFTDYKLNIFSKIPEGGDWRDIEDEEEKKK